MCILLSIMFCELPVGQSLPKPGLPGDNIVRASQNMCTENDLEGRYV